MANLNLNQEVQVAIRGQQDLSVPGSNVMTLKVDATQATALVAGAFVKLYASNTGPMPTIVAAGVDDVGWGIILFDVKQDSYSAGDECQVGIIGTVVWVVAGGTIAPNAQVEDNADGTVVTKSSHKSRGFALDPGSAANLMRILVNNPVTIL